MRRFTLLTFCGVTHHPLSFLCPLLTFPPSLPSPPSRPAINHLVHSLGRCQARNAHRPWQKKAGCLRGEKRDRERTVSFKSPFSHFKMQHTNFHVNLLCDSGDGCLWLSGRCVASIEEWKWSHYVGSSVTDVEGKWLNGLLGNRTLNI